ncbi:cysteine-rich CWC family protein [Chitinophaga sp. Cy-1792]|uniref:cysteine-rich CWC family protein n=1 Tax=Chitinophaga sp. Cy-1792 TaxID=2608339 RepID=UPI00141F794D|nr:cysteine-rich CWC family protein [Chitinophaga sp. Cy-1792]
MPVNDLNTEICPRCGKTLVCDVGNITRCWCTEVVLSREERTYIGERFEGCLCPDCIKEIKAEIAVLHQQ